MKVNPAEQVMSMPAETEEAGDELTRDEKFGQHLKRAKI